MKKLIVVLEGGGMRNAFTSGVLSELSLLGLKPNHVSAIYACSSANGPAAFFISQQQEKTFPIWEKMLTRWDILNPLRPLRGLPLGDIEWVVKQTFAALDLAAVENSSTRLLTAILQLKTGETHHIRWHRKIGQRLFMASGAMPFVTRPIEVLGIKAVDGGTAKPLPFAEAVAREGNARYLVISNKAPQQQLPRYGSILAKIILPGYPAAQRAFLGRREHNASAWKMITTPPSGCRTFVITPTKGFRCKRLTRAPLLVRQAISQGQNAAQQAWQQGGLDNFLELH